MDLNNIFDQNVELYEDWFKANNYIFEAELTAIKQLLPVSGEGIEIGIGTGVFSERLGIKKGIEPSFKMRERAIERGINVIQAFAENLPIQNGAYGFALMVTVDCFLNDILQAFKEVCRILSSDGHFIIAFIDKETPLGRIYDQNKHTNRFYKDAIFRSAQEIKKLLITTGFCVADERQTVFSLDNKSQDIKEGCGEGVFAVIKAKKL